jgi:hypothetical protein
MQVDRSAWSGEGDLTIRLLEALQQVEGVAGLRVEDSPASRSGAGYNLLANEIHVAFAAGQRLRRGRWLGVVLRTRPVEVPRLTLPGLESRLAAVEDVGHADYADDGMLQYLRTERVVPPYQTRGYKLVELVRIYAAGPSIGGAGLQSCPVLGKDVTSSDRH